MFNLFRKPRASPPSEPEASLPPGLRVYAVGDVHGRLDLFAAMIEAIEADDAASPPADTQVILLGDLVDRGPDSAGVIARARQWQQARKVAILAGNHEEMFLRSFDDAEVLRHFLRHGGRETILSYGCARDRYAHAGLEDVQLIMRETVPAEDIAFIEGFGDQVRLGDYLFVHAGIHPDRPLDEQSPRELRWIREPFLSHAEPFGPVVVHGHSITEDPELRSNRIGIDTGAYASGRLTALVLEGRERRFIETAEESGTVTTHARAA